MDLFAFKFAKRPSNSSNEYFSSNPLADIKSKIL